MKQDNNIWDKEDLRKLETLCKSLDNIKEWY